MFLSLIIIIIIINRKMNWLDKIITNKHEIKYDGWYVGCYGFTNQRYNKFHCCFKRVKNKNRKITSLGYKVKILFVSSK